MVAPACLRGPAPTVVASDPTTNAEQLAGPSHAGIMLGAIVSVGALAGVVLWASGQEQPRIPRGGRELGFLLVAVALYGAATLLRGTRWDMIMRLAGIGHRRFDAYALLPVGYMGNNVLPARGGELRRIFLLGQRASARRREILGTVVAERVLDAVVLVGLFGLLTLTGVGHAPISDTLPIASVGAVIAAVAAALAYLRLRRAGRFARFAKAIRPVAKASRPLLRPAGLLLVGMTTAVWVIEALIFALVARSLGLHITVLEGLFLDVLASFFALIPAAPAYAGTFDAAILFGLHALDIRGGEAVSFAILVRFVLFVPITIAGLGLLVARYGGLTALWRRRGGAPVEA